MAKAKKTTAKKTRGKRSSGASNAISMVIPAFIVAFATKIIGNMLAKWLDTSGVREYQDVVLAFIVMKIMERVAPQYALVARVQFAMKLADMAGSKVFSGLSVRSLPSFSGYNPRPVDFPVYAGPAPMMASRSSVAASRMPVYRTA